MSSDKRYVVGYDLTKASPALEEAGQNGFSLDSKEPDWTKFQDFLMGEVRYASLAKTFPEEAEVLFRVTQENAKWRYNQYRKLVKLEDKPV